MLQLLAGHKLQIAASELFDDSFPVCVQERDCRANAHIAIARRFVRMDKHLQAMKLFFAPCKFFRHRFLQLFSGTDSATHLENSFLPWGTIFGIRTEARTPDPECFVRISADK